jgi:ADP-heptose:LPS heptosyltransferase
MTKARIDSAHDFSHSLLLGSSPKIAVLHAKALGDLIVALPALGAIKATYPDAELTLLARPWAKEFLSARRSAVDRVISVPVLAGVNDESVGATKGPVGCARPKYQSAGIEQFYHAMQAQKFAVAIHLQGDGKAVNPFINRLGAGLTVGLRNEGAEALDRFVPYVHYQSEILRNLEVVALVGAHTTQLEPHVEVTEADEQETAVVREIIKGKPYVILHAGADDVRRVWPAAKFASLADDLFERGYQVVLTGTPKEEEIVTNVMRAMKRAAIPCTSLGLGGLAALLRKSSLVISNDTGPLHLARAVGARTIGIFWAPNVLNWGPLTRNKHRLAISWQLECPRCGIKPVSPWPFQPVTEQCQHSCSFVESVPVTEVFGFVAELLPS